MTDISRRSLLGTAAALGLGPVASAAMAGVSAPQKWDRTVNFLIIGTGFAGLAAALEAHEQGMKSVLVVDKMPTSTAATPSLTAAPLPQPAPTCRKKPASRITPTSFTATS